MTSHVFERLFGPRRAPETPITQREMDLAASVQCICEDLVLRIARHARKVTGLSSLCMAGGVALNAVANGKLARERIFDDVWVQPAAGDAGGALGAAYLAWHRHFGAQRAPALRGDTMGGALLGPEYDPDTIAGRLETAGLRYHAAGDDRTSPPRKPIAR